MFFGGPPDDGDWQDEHEETEEAPNTGSVNTTEYYELLELTKEATTEQIKKAFRKRALKEHPDKGGDPNKFKRLKEAYDTLINPEKRQLYDEYGEEGVANGGPPGRGGFGDHFNQPRKMKPKLIELSVTLEEIFFGKLREVSVKRQRICSDCNGKGGSKVVKCQPCKGKGMTVRVIQLGPGMYTQAQAPCQKCEGQGQTVSEDSKCSFCNGKKMREQQKVLQVTIEKGVPDSHDYIFHGESDEYPGVESGDVYVRVNIEKHPLFERRGADIVFHKEITLLEALTGVTIELTHLDGKQYIIATAPGQILENKELKTVHRLGLPFYKDPQSFGNLYFEFKVHFPAPKSLTTDQEKILRAAFAYTETNDGLDKKEDAALLSDFTEDELNPKAGIQEDEQEEEGEGQGIPCQQQ